MRPAQGLSPRLPVATDVTAFSTCSRPSRCAGPIQSYGNTAPRTTPGMECHEPAHTAIPPPSSCTKYHNPKASVKRRPDLRPCALRWWWPILFYRWAGLAPPEEDRLDSAATRTARAVILPAALIIT